MTEQTGKLQPPKKGVYALVTVSSGRVLLLTDEEEMFNYADGSLKPIDKGGLADNKTAAFDGTPSAAKAGLVRVVGALMENKWELVGAPFSCGNSLCQALRRNTTLKGEAGGRVKM